MKDDVNPEWEAEVQRECIDKLLGCDAVTTLWTGKVDWKIAIEMGTALLTDKPIILCVPPGTHVPNNLAKVAFRIVEGSPSDPTTMDRLQKAMLEAVGD